MASGPYDLGPFQTLSAINFAQGDIPFFILHGNGNTPRQMVFFLHWFTQDSPFGDDGFSIANYELDVYSPVGDWVATGGTGFPSAATTIVPHPRTAPFPVPPDGCQDMSTPDGYTRFFFQGPPNTYVPKTDAPWIPEPIFTRMVIRNTTDETIHTDIDVASPCTIFLDQSVYHIQPNAIQIGF